MNRFFSLPRIALALAVLAILALAVPRAAAEDVPFEVHGTWIVLERRGNELLVSVEGHAHPNGPVSFTFTPRLSQHGTVVKGMPTLNFNHGTLTVYYEVELDPGTGIYEGEFIVLWGTGIFTGVTGGGEICYPLGGGIGTPNPFMMEGTLSR